MAYKQKTENERRNYREADESGPLAVKLQPEWCNEPTWKDLHSDYIAAQDDHALFVEDLQRWATNMEGGPPIKTTKGKSVSRPLVIRKQAEWTYPMLEEPFLNSRRMFDVQPTGPEDINGAKQNQDVLNYQWEHRINKVELMNDISRTLTNEGTVIVKTGWEYKEEEVTTIEKRPIYADGEESLQMINDAVASGRLAPEKAQAMIETGEPMISGYEEVEVVKKVIIRNNPKHIVRDNENITFDPTCNGKLSKANFLVDEYDISMSELKENEYNPETGEGYYHNLHLIDIDAESSNATTNNEIYTEDKPNDESFQFKDKPRKPMRAYEYWGYWDIDGSGIVKPIVATWIGSTMIRMEKNPFPFEGIPYDMSKYMPKKGKIHGEPDGELIEENQVSIGKLKRAAHDITTDKAIGQEFINENFFASPSEKDNYKNGRTVYFRDGKDPKTSIYRSNVDPVPNVVFNMMNMENAEAESLTGTKSFNNGISGDSYGSSVGGIRSAESAVGKRKMSILRRISDMIKNLGEKDIAMNQVYLSDEEVIRLTNNEFVRIKREDLKGNFDLTVQISTPEKDNDTAEKLNMLMQTNAASMNPELANKVYGKMADLWYMPDIAEDFRNFKPEPDPAQQELMQLKLENERLINKKLQMEILDIAKGIEGEDSKIEERKSRTLENVKADTREKEAQALENEATALLNRAKAEKLQAETDILDQKFVRTHSGQERAEHELDKEYDAMTKKEQMAFNHLLKKSEAKQGGQDDELRRHETTEPGAGVSDTEQS